MFQSILVVCAGNICRSPAGAFILRALLKDKHITVNSAGIIAQQDKPADKQIMTVAAQNGVDLTPHRSQPISSALISEHDLILVMEQQHYHDVINRYPEARGKVFLLAKWLGDKDIPDPYRKSDDMFKHVYTLIEQACKAWQTYL